MGYHQILSSRIRNPRRLVRLERRGTTVVEFALVFPIVLTFIFGAVMFFGVTMTQNTLAAAARAGGRMASFPDVSTDVSVIAAVEDRLDQGGVDSSLATIVVTPSVSWGALTTGDEVSISVSMPMAGGAWINLGGILTGLNLNAEMTYIRE